MKLNIKYIVPSALIALAVLLGGGEMMSAMAANPGVPLDLIPPTQVSGFASGLQTGGGDLTRLVVLITNYVLGFLGLIALTGIIYAGILYVANFGNEEMTGKAKTIITYVSIGILVILLSYAFVNALVGVVGQGNQNTGGGGLGGSPGRIGVSDSPVTTLDSLFDVEGKDFVLPLVTTLRQLGDLCNSTPIGLAVDNFGCAQQQLVADTDSDGVANLLDSDDDDDGLADEIDPDADGDGVCDRDSGTGCSGGPDLCPDTLSFVSFKVTDQERVKIQVDRVDEGEYNAYIRSHQGCAEYERASDIDGDQIPDFDDCDADADGIIDNEECAQEYFVEFPPGNPENANVTPETTFRGIVVLDVFRNELDDDDDNDEVIDFGAGLQPDARDLLLRQIANNFNSLEGFIRITCATLPQTQRVQDYCGYNPQGQPFGKLVRILDQISSDLAFTNFDDFNAVYQEFLAIAQSFPRVQVQIAASQFEGFLPPDGAPFTVSFDASQTIDPYEEFCPVDNEKYFWFVNKTLDFSQGLVGVLNSDLNPPDGTGVFFDHEFPESGIFNVQLLVRSACKYNVVNPGAGERDDVDAAIAGLANARISVFPPRAQLVVRVNGEDDQGNRPIRILTGSTGPIDFDLTQSKTNRGAFEFLNYNCGQGITNTIQGNETNWQFQCSFPNAIGTQQVLLSAQDGEGEVERTLTIDFSDVIADLRVEPGLKGTTATTFTFDGSLSSAAQQISNFSYIIERKVGTSFEEVERIQEETVTYTFEEPGEYRVTLEVSTGGAANQVSTDVVDIVIDEQDPIAAFKISYPENIRPARALFDGTLSFHPDFPDDDQNDVLAYVWEVDGVNLQERSATNTGPFTYQQVTPGRDDQIFFDFQTVGAHEVGLTVVRGEGRDTVFETTDVETLLGVDFEVDKPAAKINEVITFTPQSDKALGYFWDFGDDTTQVADDQPVVHIYERQGEYLVKLTVEDAVGNTNEIEKKVRVGLDNVPIPFVQVFVNNIEQDLTQSDCIEVSRRDNVLFDGSRSVNVRGETSGLAYLWEIEDFEEIVRTRTFTRIFKDLTRGGCIDVDFSLTDLSTQGVAEEETVSIEVVNLDPILTDLRYTVTQPQLVTPVTVTVDALGVRDLDGRAVRYRWWYYEDGQGQRQLDSRITDTPRTSFVIGPNAVEGTETTYFFAVEVEDNDGGRANSLDELGPSEPLIVTNGPNIAPVAEFVTDRGTVGTDELITFTSTTVDPLGEFIPSAGYQWDFEGDGEYERGISGPKVTFRYAKPGVYKPTLRVTKNGLSSQYEMDIRVLPTTEEPQAAFIFVQSGARVKFISNSSVDPLLDNKELQHAWDFDTTIDTDGNGILDDDADSALLAPEYEFEGDRDVLVGLRVTDSVGNVDTVVRKIPFIKQDTSRGPLGATQQVALRAVLNTNPPRNELDGRIYLKPSFGDVVFNAKPSLGKIQEYRIDTNIFVDSDGDSIPDNDIDNKTHKSWKDGSSFKRTYRESEGDIRARLTVVDLDGRQKSQVVDVVFAEEEPTIDLDTLDNPDDILQLLESVPVVRFDVDKVFAQPDELLTFDASGTQFPDEQVEEYRWDFDGDGLVDEISFEPTFTHAFSSEGAFDVVLEAVSDGGLQGEYSQTVFIRGGLLLPQADFRFTIEDNQAQFTNTSVVDDSFSPDEIQLEWEFQRLDLSTALEWESWQSEDRLVLEERSFNGLPVWVKSSLQMDAAEVGTGVIAPELVLGDGPFYARFIEGTTLVDENADPFVGTLELNEQGDLPDIEGKTVVARFDTGVDGVLNASETVLLMYDGVIFNAELHRLDADGEPVLVAEGSVDTNLTVFEADDFGGSYVLTGDLEESGEDAGVSLGTSTVADPLKVFSEAGLYQVVLTITDGVGEQSQKTELITIDQDLSAIEPVVIEPEEIITDPVSEDLPSTDVTTPVVVDDSNGGFSYFWIAVLVLILLIVGAVVFIVVKTIRERQEELEGEPLGAPKAAAKKPEVLEPEVVAPPPAAAQSSQGSAAKAPKADTGSPAQGAAPAKKESAPAQPAAETSKEKKDDTKNDGGSSGSSGGGSASGPIPDWLKG